jgi:hypothetical protein
MASEALWGFQQPHWDRCFGQMLSKIQFSESYFGQECSAGEVRSHLFVALDLGYVTSDEFDDLRAKAEDVAKALSGFITYLASKDPM